MNDRIEAVLFHPVVALSAVASLVLSTVGQLAPLWDFVGATASLWFPAIAVSAGTILPNVGFPDLGTNVLLAAGIVYVAVYVDRFADRLIAFIRQ